MQFQVAVIGSGPGGYIAAIRAAQLGFKTVVFEKDARLGGTCLNVGCIPSKSLLHDSYLAKLGVPTDLAKMLDKKNDVVKGLTDGVAMLFKKHGIVSVQGEAYFESPHVIVSGDQKFDVEHVIIATGSIPSQIPFLPFDEKRIVSSTGALSFEKAPARLLVVGGGVIGVELASVWHRMGSDVTVVEMLPEILATMDPSISRSLLSTLQRQGLKFMLGVKVEGATVTSDFIKVMVNGKEIEADAVLVATGRRPYTQNLKLENAGIKTTVKGFIPVNGVFETETKGVYAIGDVIEGPMLAHKAMEEGVAVVERIAGLNTHMDYMSIPNVVYTHPEAASVGMTEPEARKLERELIIGTCHMKAIGRARCNGDTEGFVKVIGDKKTGRLLGMHLVAESASEMVGEGVAALVKKATIQEIASMSHAHPTLCEAIKESALAALGHPLSF